jgi:hypothetical protein
MAKQKLEGNNKIISLANKLIKAINEQGISVMCPDIAKDFGGFDIVIYGPADEPTTIEVVKLCENGGNSFKFTGDLVGKIK